MKRPLPLLFVAATLAVGSVRDVPVSSAKVDVAQSPVVVRFGTASNTMGESNHRIVPQRIRATVGQPLDFAVRGFHQVVVYAPGIKLTDLNLPGATNQPFINDFRNVFYRGANPSDGADRDPSGTRKLRSRAARAPGQRVESLTFQEPGEYLVICNVYPHFREGMHAQIIVTRE